MGLVALASVLSAALAGTVGAQAQSEPRALRVEVVDANGRPAGRLRVFVNPDHKPVGVRNQTRFTDAEGRATFDLELLDPKRQVGRWHVLPELLGGGQRVTVDCTAGPEDVVLRLPPAGSVRYIFYGQDGVPAGGFTEARLGRLKPIAVDAQSATFYPVPLRQPAIATAKVEGIEGWLSTRATGPEVVGGMRVVEGGFADCGPVLEVRVRADGEILADTEVGLIYAAADRVFTPVVRTGADGAVRWAVPVWAAREPEPWLDLQELQVIRLPETGRGPGGRVEVDPIDVRPDQPIVDMGDVEIEPFVSLGTGRVVDADGNGVAGILVRSAWTGVATKQFPNTSSAVLPDWAWREHRATTDEQGRYEFFGLERMRRDSRLWVHAADHWRVRRPPIAEVGRALPTITLDRVFCLEGSLTPALPKGVRIIAKARGTDRNTWPVVVDPDGSFSFSGLPPQEYAVRVAGHVVRRVTVGPGVEPDPRLDPLDWGEHRRLLRVTVVDPDGEPVRARVVGRAGKPPRPFNFGRTDELGQAVQLVPRDTVELEVMADRQWFPAKASTSEAEATLRVRPCPQVEVRLAGVTPPKGLELVAALVPEGASVTLESHGWASARGWSLNTVRLDPRATLTAFEPGRFKVVLLPGPPGQAAALPEALRRPLGERAFVVASDGRAPESLAITLKDAAVLQRLHDALRKGR